MTLNVTDRNESLLVSPYDNTCNINIGEEPLRTTRFYVCRVFLPIVLIAGGVGNPLNILVLWKTKVLMGVSYVYMRWLAVADFCEVVLWSVFLVTLHCVPSTSRSVHLARFYAHVYQPVFNAVACASNHIVMAMTIDRYLAICHPLKALRIRTRTVAMTAIAIIYTYAFIFHVPFIFDFYVESRTDPATNQTYYNAFWNRDIHKYFFYSTVWPWIAETINKFIPVTTVVILNSLILRGQQRSRKRRITLTSKRTSTDELLKRWTMEERHLAALLVSVSIIFVVCTIPQALLIILTRMISRDILDSTAWFPVFREIANLLEAVNFAANFYVYSLTNASFRRASRHVLYRKTSASQNGFKLHTASQVRDSEHSHSVASIGRQVKKLSDTDNVYCTHF